LGAFDGEEGGSRVASIGGSGFLLVLARFLLLIFVRAEEQLVFVKELEKREQSTVGEASDAVLEASYLFQLGWVHVGLLATGEARMYELTDFRQRFGWERRRERPRPTTPPISKHIFRFYNQRGTCFKLTK